MLDNVAIEYFFSNHFWINLNLINYISAGCFEIKMTYQAKEDLPYFSLGVSNIYTNWKVLKQSLLNLCSEAILMKILSIFNFIWSTTYMKSAKTPVYT
jgi:hypothetical protein